MVRTLVRQQVDLINVVQSNRYGCPADTKCRGNPSGRAINSEPTLCRFLIYLVHPEDEKTSLPGYAGTPSKGRIKKFPAHGGVDCDAVTRRGGYSGVFIITNVWNNNLFDPSPPCGPSPPVEGNLLS